MRKLTKNLMIGIKLKRIKFVIKVLAITFFLMLFARTASGQSMRMIIANTAVTVKVPVALLLGICTAESELNPKAFNEDDPSYGLCQVMLPTAQQMGFKGTVIELFNPQTNVYYAAKYLKWQLKRYRGDWISVIAAYNAGSVLRNSKGRIINLKYVDKVIKKIGGRCE